MITGVKHDPFLASCPPNCYWQWKEQWKDLWECDIFYHMKLCQDSGHSSHHLITSRQNRLQTLSSAVYPSQTKKPTCFLNTSVPFTCHSNVLSTYHFPELFVSFDEAKGLCLSYLSHYKVNSAHTTCGKQKWICKTDNCTLRQQLIDSNFCQRQRNLRGTKNLWNARVDSYQTATFSHLKYSQKEIISFGICILKKICISDFTQLGFTCSSYNYYTSTPSCSKSKTCSAGRRNSFDRKIHLTK